jgi:glycosidase
MMNLYHIYVWSFKDGNSDGIGDLKGLLSKMDYLNTLDVDAVYLSPVWETGKVDWGYDTKDYTRVEPLLGTENELKQVVEELHKQGKKVIFDLVLNHVSTQHEWFQKALGGDPYYKKFFIWLKKPNNWISYMRESVWEYVPELGEYYLHMFHRTMPDLNWRNPEVYKVMLDIVSDMVLRYDIDGFRLDVINLLLKREDFVDATEDEIKHHAYAKLPETVDLVTRFFNDVKSRTGKDLYLIGEVSTRDYEVWKKWYSVLDTYFDFNFNQQDSNSNFFDAPTFYEVIDKNYKMWKQTGKLATVPIGNHDTPRLATKFGEELGRDPDFVQAVFNIFGIFGPWYYSLYYGSELAMTNPILPDDYIPRDQLLDVPSCKGGRDVGRSPMSWTGKKHAGFSNVDPWIPLAGNYKTNNVQLLPKILEQTRGWISLRKMLGNLLDVQYSIINQMLYMTSVYQNGSVFVETDFYNDKVLFGVREDTITL